jgi:hypothetical protein
MAEVIAGVISYFATGAYVYGAAAYMGYAYVALVAAAAVYGGYAQRKAKSRARDAANANVKDRELMIRSAVAPRRIVYGRDKISGPVVYIQSTGAKQEFLHIVVALAAHECDAIETVYFNDIPLTIDGSGWSTNTEFISNPVTGVALHIGSSDGSGTITLDFDATSIQALYIETGTGDSYGQTPVEGYTHTPGSDTITDLPVDTELRVAYTYVVSGTPRVRIRKYLGASGQTADADLISESGGLWTADHIGEGICYVYARLEFDPDVFGSIGIPNISAVVRGKKVYDPRTETTVWSNNPALCMADFLKSDEGMRATDAEVPDDEVITAANICEEVIDLDELSEETQLRYTSDLSFTTEQSPQDVLTDLANCMAGRAVWTQGRWLVRAGAYRTPTLTINADMLAGSVSVIPRASRSELFNAVRATHRNPDEAYAEVQAPLVLNAGYEGEDGDVRIVRQIDIPTLADTYRAQRLAKIELERAHQALTVRFVCNLKAYDLAPTDTAMLTLALYGWSAKVFEVIDRTLTREGKLQYTLRETAAGVWEWAFGEATVGDLAPNTELPSPYDPPAALTGLTVTDQAVLASDGTVILQALLEWDPSADAFVRGGGKIDVQWARADRLDQISSYAVPGDSIQATAGPLIGDLAYIARVRQVNAVGRSGDWTYVNWVAQSDFTPPEDVTGLDWEIKPYQVRIFCDPCVALDYAETELRFMLTEPVDDSDWDAATFLTSGKGNEYKHARPPNGTYYVLAKHRDTTGNYSENAAWIEVIVDDSIDTGGGGTLSLTTDRFPFFLFSTGTTHTAIAPGDTTITITAQLFNLFGTAAFVAEAFDARTGGASLGTFTLGGSGNERTMSAAQFVSLGTSGSVRRVRVTATLGSADDFLDIYRQDPTETAPFLFLSNPKHQVPTDESGEFGDYSGAHTDAVVYEGVDDTTADWDFAKDEDAGMTATINGVAGPVANPATVTVAVSAMTISTGAVLITASQSGETDLTASFIVDKSEANGTGYTWYFDPRSEINLLVDVNGEVTNFDDAFSSLRILLNGQLDDSVNWNFSKEDINVVSTLTDNLVEVTAYLDLGVLGTSSKVTLNLAGAGWTGIFAVYYADGVWLALGNHATTPWNYVIRSEDYATWTLVNVGVAGRWQLAAFDQGAWVLVEAGVGSTNKTMRSTDGGLTWSSAVTLSVSSQWSDMAAGGGRMIVTRSGNVAGQTSTDGGASWGSITLPVTGANVWYGGGYWLANVGGTTHYITTTPTGAWTTDTATFAWPIMDAVDYMGRLVVTFNSNIDKAAYREPGGPWVTVTLPAVMNGAHLVIVKGVLYMLQNSGAKMMFSTDGKSWQQGDNPPGNRPVVRQDSSMDVDFLPLFELLLDEVQVAPLLATSATEGAVRVTATKPGALPITAILPVFKGSPDKDLYTFQANPVFIAIPATSDGAVTDWTNATTTVQANKNGEPDATWTWVWTATNMTPSSGTGATATFTAMSADAGQVTFRGSKAGQKDIVGTLNIVKVKGQLPSGPLIGAGMALFSTTQTYIAVKFLGDGRIQVKRGSGGSYVNAALWAGNVSSANNVCMLWVDELGPDTLTSGTTGSWLALTTDREFVLQDISSGTHTVNLEVQIATDNTYEKILQGFGGLQLVVP